MNTKKIITHTLAFGVIALPVIAFAAGGHDANEAPHADGHNAGAPAIVSPGSPAWYGLIAVSVLLMSALSYWVYHYIQVAPVPKMTPKTKSDEKLS